MAIQWHQVEEWYASEEGHFIRVKPLTMGSGYSATMHHLNDEGVMEFTLIPTKNEQGQDTTGVPFNSIQDAKAAAERFLTDHLATPPAQRENRLVDLMNPTKHG